MFHAACMYLGSHRKVSHRTLFLALSGEGLTATDFKGDGKNMWEIVGSRNYSHDDFLENYTVTDNRFGRKKIVS